MSPVTGTKDRMLGKRFFAPLRMTFLVSLSLCGLGGLEVQAKTDYKIWLTQEVVWIISKAEREEFSRLTSDAEREAFIGRFWKRRDPTPETPRNEYKEEHYRRLQYASKTFGEGIPGWKADRGRIYILHGPPAESYYYPSLSTISPLRQVAPRERSPNTHVWVYHSLADARYYRGELVLVFQPSTGLTRQNFVLGESRQAQENADKLTQLFSVAANQNFLEADVRYCLIMAGPPAMVNRKGAELSRSGLGETARYMGDLLRSPGDVLDEKQREGEQREQAKRSLREVVEGRMAVPSLEFRLSHSVFLKPNGQFFIPLEISLPVDPLAVQTLSPPNEGKSSGEAGRLEIYASVTNAGSGEVVDEFIERLDLGALERQEWQGSDRHVHYRNHFLVPEGRYRLRAAVRREPSRKLGLREREIRAEVGRLEKMTLSEVYLTNSMESMQSTADAARNPGAPVPAIEIQGLRLLPPRSERFSPADHLYLYFQIHNPTLSERSNNPHISIAVQFIKDEAVFRRLDPRIVDSLTDPSQRLIDYATAIPLEGFEPGDYTLQLQAIDQLGRTFVVRRAPLQIGN